MVFLFYRCLLVPLISMSSNSLRSTPALDLTLVTYNIIGGGRWVNARGTVRRLCFLHRSTLNYTKGGIKLNHCILPYNPTVDLKTIQKTIRLRLFHTQTYWKGLNFSNNRTQTHRDDDDDSTTAASCTTQERAEGKVTLTRRRTCGNKVRI